MSRRGKAVQKEGVRRKSSEVRGGGREIEGGREEKRNEKGTRERGNSEIEECGRWI